MIKILRVGDPHTMVSNLKDSNALLQFTLDTAIKEKVDAVEFLGDLFHTHAVLRVEIVHFWQKWFQKFEMENIDVRVIVGNHDQPGSREKEQEMNALDVFIDETGDSFRTIINEPMIIDGIAYIPYMSDKDEFVRAAMKLAEEGATTTLVCHQTFTGAVYENGQPAEDSVFPDIIPQTQIISGHIHKEQEFGKVFYQGTAKYDKLSDANEKKGIWLYTHNDDRSVKTRNKISTEKIVSAIYKFVINEGEDVPPIKKNSRTYLEFKGKSAWIKTMKKKYKGKARVKGVPTDRRIVFSSGSEAYTLEEHVRDNFDPIEGVSKENILEFLRGINERRLAKAAA